MYDVYSSDSYFFSNEFASLMEQKDKYNILSIITEKHKDETNEHIPVITKKNDLLIWNVLFAKEIIKQGTSKQYIHTIYNKYYKDIQSLNTLESLQELEINIATSYLDILLNFVEITNNLIVNKIIGYLYIHIENHLTLEDIANNLNISIGYLSNCFKKNMGISVMRYLKKIKIDRARILLTSTDKSILEISTLLSFCDQCNFSKAFKDIVGITPLEYRNIGHMK